MITTYEIDIRRAHIVTRDCNGCTDFIPLCGPIGPLVTPLDAVKQRDLDPEDWDQVALDAPLRAVLSHIAGGGDYKHEFVHGPSSFGADDDVDHIIVRSESSDLTLWRVTYERRREVMTLEYLGFSENETGERK